MLSPKLIRCLPALLLVLLAWTPNVQCQTISSNWLTATDGTWTDPSNWSTTAFPNNGSPNQADQYDALIDAAGSGYTVTLADDIALNSLTLDSPDAVLVQQIGDLVVDSINLAQGTFEAGGTIVGATISGGGNLVVSSRFNSPRLQDVTLATDFSAATSSLTRISGDLTLDNADWTFDSRSASGAFDDLTPQAIRGNGALQFMDGNRSGISISSELTVGSGVTIESLTGSGNISNGRLINDGTLRSAAGTSLTLGVDEFVNNGEVDAGGVFRLGNNLDTDSTWTNQGTITLRPDSVLQLAGTFTQADLGTVVNEGAREVTLFGGVLDNTGDTLDLSNLVFNAPLQLNSGTIKGGRIVGDAGTELLAVAGVVTLDGVTIGSDLVMADEAFVPRFNVVNGLTIDGATLTAFESTNLFFSGDGPQTLDGTGTILAANRPNTSGFTSITGEQLVIGEDITIRNGDLDGQLNLDFAENRGTIIAESANGRVSIDGSSFSTTSSTFTNNGSIVVLDGILEFGGRYSVEDIGDLTFLGGQVILDGTVANEDQTIRQDASTGLWQLRGTVEGGRLETGDGLVADVRGRFENVTLAGDAEIIDDTQSSADGSLFVEESLTFEGGTLTIGDSAELGISQSVLLTGNGEIFLNGSPGGARIQTFTGGEVVIDSGIAVRTGPTGGGTISRSTLPVINRGVISAETAGQTLVLGGSLENTGSLQASNSSTLQIVVDDWTNEGRIEVDGGEVAINSTSFENGTNGTVSGNGTISLPNATFFNAGTISAGSSSGDFTGLLTIEGDASFLDTSVFNLEIGGLESGEFDEFAVSGALALGGSLNASLVDGFSLEADQEFIFAMGGDVTGAFFGLEEGALIGQVGSRDLFITYAAGDGNDVAVFTAAVPEPSSAGLMLICFAVLAGSRKRRS